MSFIEKFSSDFNPRLPYGRRPGFLGWPIAFSGNFNPRLPYGRRRYPEATEKVLDKFQSTPPIRETTFAPAAPCSRRGYFNPRLPYGRRRRLEWGNLEALCDFNPRLPYGRRQNCRDNIIQPFLFQSTPPIRETTTINLITSFIQLISIHASHTGDDTPCTTALHLTSAISIHASHTGDDVMFAERKCT